ncbi:MAG: hypothetical protein ONB23_08300 [candidate division KSB1 bacterium]|nr:hypothetical protein [candidate division KSB1 bacterium]
MGWEQAGVVLLTYFLSVPASGWVVQQCCGWLLRRVDTPTLRAWVSQGLPGGGRLIGWLERFLITTFVLMGEPTAIAVVLAAKGILRFPEISGRPGEQQRVVAEYVIIGTLLSFCLATGISALAKLVLSRLGRTPV